jgi:NRPS condensation-like uncharacterized protein
MIGDMLIHCVLVFNGRMDEVRMARAIRLSLDAEPVLGCRFVHGFWRGQWERRDDLDSLQICEVVPVSDPDAAIQDFLTLPIDPLEGPQVKARILRSETDTLCLKVNHMAADAGGVKAYAGLVSGIYRSLGRNPGYQACPNTGSRSLWQVGRQMDTAQRLRIICRGYRNAVSDWIPGEQLSVMLHAGQPVDPGFSIRRIGPGRFNLLKSYGRQWGATLNDIIIAAWFRALFKETESEQAIPFRMLTTADLRRFMPGRQSQAICNLSGFIHLNIGKRRGWHFHDTLMRVQDEMRAQKKEVLGLGDIVTLGLLAKLIPLDWYKVMAEAFLRRHIDRAIPLYPAMTNMGIIPLDRLAFETPGLRDAYLTAPLIFPPYFILGLSGFTDSITLSIGFCQKTLNRPIIENLLDRVEEELSSLQPLPGGNIV